MSCSRRLRRIRLGAFALVLATGAPAAFAGETLQFLKDINPGPASSGPGGLVKMGAFVYFRASAEDGKTRLFRTDGTTTGTTVVASGPAAPENPGLADRRGQHAVLLCRWPGEGLRAVEERRHRGAGPSS